MTVIKTSAETFERDVLQAEGLVVVDMYADWCGPCRMVAPIIDELAGEHSDVKFVKLNVDEAPEISSAYRVTGIPTIGFFKGGDLVHSSVGAKPKRALEAELATAQSR